MKSEYGTLLDAYKETHNVWHGARQMLTHLHEHLGIAGYQIGQQLLDTLEARHKAASDALEAYSFRPAYDPDRPYSVSLIADAA